MEGKRVEVVLDEVALEGVEVVRRTGFAVGGGKGGDSAGKGAEEGGY